MSSPALTRAEQKVLDEARVDALATTYARSQARLQRIVDDVDATDFSRARSAHLLKQVTEEITRLDTQAAKWAKGAAESSYDAGIELAAGRLEVDVNTFGTALNREAVAVITEQIANDLLTANAGISKKLQSYLRATRQRVIEEAQINRLIAQGVTEGATRRQVSNALVRALEEKLGEGKMIPVLGKDGVTRNYQPQVYARMVATAKTREAASAGTIAACAKLGNDLVQVSVHTGSCDICLPYQGKVYSISGTHADFPALGLKPPYHPFCRHVLLPVSQDALEERGEYEEIVKLSKKRGFEFADLADYNRRVKEAA